MIPFLGGVALGAFAGTVLLMRNLWDRGDGRAMRREIKQNRKTPSTQFQTMEDFWRDLERVDSV